MKQGSLNYGHKLQVTARMRFKVQAARMRFLCGVAGLTVRDKARSSAIHRNLCIELLLLCHEGSQPRLSGPLVLETTDIMEALNLSASWRRFSQVESRKEEVAGE